MPLPDTFFRPLASLLNRRIGELTPARELCAKLDGQSVAVRVRDTGLAMRFDFHEDLVSLVPLGEEEPDAAISGSLLSLVGALRGDGESALHGGSLEVSGDAETAAAFSELLRFARPDPEEELSRLVGDTAAYRIGSLARNLRDWARQSGATMSANLREYLQEESREAPSRYEYERFAAELGTLRDDVDRLAARIDRLADGS